MRIVIGAAFALIIFSLANALFHLTRKQGGEQGKVVKALSWRIGASIGLFILVLIANHFGWISPTGIR